MNAYTTAMRRYFDFSGRSSRSEFWLFVLIYLIIAVIAKVIDTLGLGFSIEATGIVSGIVALIHFIPNLSVGVRRLHDSDRSGWWYLIILIPLIGAIWLIVLWCFSGTAGVNRFGPPSD